MKKLISLMMAIMILLTPAGVHAKDVKDLAVLRQGNQIIAFQPSILSVQNQRSSMVVNVDASTVAFMYQVQWSDRPDFKDAENRFFRNEDNRGCMIIDYFHVRQNGKLYAVRNLWYGGYKLSYRKKEVKSTSEKLLPLPKDMILYLYNRYRCTKRLYVPTKGRYVRMRSIYYGTFYYAYSDWTQSVKVY